MTYYSFNPKGNSKTNIPTTTSAKETCPATCPLMHNGCYASNFPMGHSWNKLSHKGLEWDDLIAHIGTIRRGHYWRHNAAGDLLADPDGFLNLSQLSDLIEANQNRFGFTYTHQNWRKNLSLLKVANAKGFTINVSTDSLADALEAYAEGLPTTVILDGSGKVEYHDDIAFVTCPNQTVDVTCADCKLCYRAERDFVIVFRPHGARRKTITRVIAALNI